MFVYWIKCTLPLKKKKTLYELYCVHYIFGFWIIYDAKCIVGKTGFNHDVQKRRECINVRGWSERTNSGYMSQSGH